MAGIYLIRGPGGWGYIGLTSLNRPIERVSDHVINSYELNNYHSYLHGQRQPENSVQLAAQIQKNGADRFAYYLNTDEGDAYGFGKEGWEIFKTIWLENGARGSDRKKAKIDIAELSLIQKFGRSHKYNYFTDENGEERGERGGTNNYTYLTGPLVKAFKQASVKMKDSFLNDFINEIENYKYEGKIGGGAVGLYYPEEEICRAVLEKTITTKLFSKQEAIEMLIDSLKGNSTLTSKATTVELIDTKAAATKIKKKVEKRLDTLNQVLSNLKSTNAVKFDYFKIKLNLQVNDVVQDIVLQLKQFKASRKKGEIVISLPRNFQYNRQPLDIEVIRTNKDFEPQWIQYCYLPYVNRTEDVRKEFLMNIAKHFENIEKPTSYMINDYFNTNGNWIQQLTTREKRRIINTARIETGIGLPPSLNTSIFNNDIHW